MLGFPVPTFTFARIIAVLLCAFACARADAATLFAIVTERAAPTAIEAAHRHLASHPKDRIILRTPAQWMAADDKQAAQWLAQADSILAVSLFGDPARRLKEALPRHARAAATVLAFNGEASLSLMSRGRQGSLQGFSPETLRQLSGEQPPPAALQAARALPAAGQWLAARQVWQAGGRDNTSALLAHLLDPARALAAPLPEPTLRVRMGERELQDAAAWGRASQLGVQARPPWWCWTCRIWMAWCRPPCAARSSAPASSACRCCRAGAALRARRWSVCRS